MVVGVNFLRSKWGAVCCTGSLHGLASVPLLSWPVRKILVFVNLDIELSLNLKMPMDESIFTPSFYSFVNIRLVLRFDPGFDVTRPTWPFYCD